MTKLTTNLIPDGSDALAGAFLAGDYHNGQWTALYAVASAGSLELRSGDGLWPLIVELREAVDTAAAHYPSDCDSLSAFLSWARDLYDRIDNDLELQREYGLLSDPVADDDRDLV